MSAIITVMANHVPEAVHNREAMPELTPTEKLQPALLDRLTDDHPGDRNESRESRVINMERLRDVVLRDLEWLFNTGNLAQVEDLSEYPEAQISVVNYGVEDLAGRAISPQDIVRLEDQIKNAILRFEPRILAHTLKVRGQLDENRMSKTGLSFEIEGQLWAQPVPTRLFLKTTVDLELGRINISELDD